MKVKKTIERCKRDLKKGSDERDTLTNVVDCLKLTLQQNTKEKHQIKQELEQVKSELEKTRAERDALVHTRERTIKQAKQDHDKMASRIKELEVKLKTYKDENAILLVQKKAQQYKDEEHQRTCAEMKNKKVNELEGKSKEPALMRNRLVRLRKKSQRSPLPEKPWQKVMSVPGMMDETDSNHQPVSKTQSHNNLSTPSIYDEKFDAIQFARVSASHSYNEINDSLSFTSPLHSPLSVTPPTSDTLMASSTPPNLTRSPSPPTTSPPISTCSTPPIMHPSDPPVSSPCVNRSPVPPSTNKSNSTDHVNRLILPRSSSRDDYAKYFQTCRSCHFCSKRS